ncbi:hypothetical protein BDV12DRAFT_27157 [Aspergillus spectabilis]
MMHVAAQLCGIGGLQSLVRMLCLKVKIFSVGMGLEPISVYSTVFILGISLLASLLCCWLQILLSLCYLDVLCIYRWRQHKCNQSGVVCFSCI